MQKINSNKQKSTDETKNAKRKGELTTFKPQKQKDIQTRESKCLRKTSFTRNAIESPPSPSGNTGKVPTDTVQSEFNLDRPRHNFHLASELDEKMSNTDRNLETSSVPSPKK